jgi:homospermidine synthase
MVCAGATAKSDAQSTSAAASFVKIDLINFSSSTFCSYVWQAHSSLDEERRAKVWKKYCGSGIKLLQRKTQATKEGRRVVKRRGEMRFADARPNDHGRAG